VRGSARVYGSRKIQHSSQVVHRQRAHTRIHGSSRHRRSAHPEARPSLPNDGDKDSPIDLAWGIRIHEPARHAGKKDARPRRTQAHMFLGDADGTIAACVEGKQGNVEVRAHEERSDRAFQDTAVEP
jgi:hypothetical protein